MFMSIKTTRKPLTHAVKTAIGQQNQLKPYEACDVLTIQTIQTD